MSQEYYVAYPISASLSEQLFVIVTSSSSQQSKKFTNSLKTLLVIAIGYPVLLCPPA
jgi:hypothetical protein